MTRNAQNLLLVAEDSDEDFEVLAYLMNELKVRNPIHRCETGREILDFLHFEQKKALSSSVKPAVILLDLNLPGIDGRQVLTRIKQDSALQSIPVVILTTSINPSDVEFCYREGANGYLIKPMEMDDLEVTVRGFINFWLNINVLPQS